MSRAIILTAILSGLIGFAAGNAFWYLASPLWIDRVVSEAPPVADTAVTIAQGEFTDADSVHKGSGTAQVLRTAGGRNILRFTNFKSTNGPDLKVYLVKSRNIKNSDDVTNSEWASLGPLKGNIGDQNYTLPEDLDSSKFSAVVIWCEQFGVLFSSANLSPAT